jgi:hypothetical protein
LLPTACFFPRVGRLIDLFVLSVIGFKIASAGDQDDRSNTNGA